MRIYYKNGVLDLLEAEVDKARSMGRDIDRVEISRKEQAILEAELKERDLPGAANCLKENGLVELFGVTVTVAE